MTDTNPDPQAAPGSPPPALGSPTPAPDTGGRLHDRMEAFGKEAQTVGEKLGRDAQAAGERLATNPTVIQAADTGVRIWGLIVLAVGLWFFAQVTLGLPLPAVAWQDLWPLALVLVGLFVIIRGMTRRA